MAGATGTGTGRGGCYPGLVGPHKNKCFLRPKSVLLSTARNPFAVNISSTNNGHNYHHHVLSTCFEVEPQAQGPFCVLVGPIESASQETLEALYRQARDAYHSGNPLIVDDMFDRIELKLRWYGSKYVVKYPRCSLRRQSTFADAQEDPAQMIALASVWFVILLFGGCVCLVPLLYTVVLAYQDTFDSEAILRTHSSTWQHLGMLSCVLFMLLGSVIGCPMTSASARALLRLWRNDLVALKGACPSCGEEVFAFMRSDQSINAPHRTDCHVCESKLEFRTQAEQSISTLGRRWVHGRVYLISERRSGRRQQLA